MSGVIALDAEMTNRSYNERNRLAVGSSRSSRAVTSHPIAPMGLM